MEKENGFFVFRPCSYCGKEIKYEAILSISNWIDDIEDCPICVDCLDKNDE